MIWLEIGLFLAVIAIGVVAYYLGYTAGAALGFADGYLYRDRMEGQ